MNRRDAAKQETRQLILSAARRLFTRKGMEECTIRDIARKAGVSPASVVVHFQSKTALLEEALNRDLEQRLSQLSASQPKGGDLLGRLMHFAQGFFRLYDKNRSLYRALVRSTIFEPVEETPKIAGLSDVYLGLLSGILEEERGRGTIRAGVDTRVAAAAVFSLYIGALIALFRQPRTPVDAIAEALKAMTAQYLEGIAVGKPAKRSRGGSR